MEAYTDFATSFFEVDKPERDRSGRPLLLPRSGEERLAYTRASGLGDLLEEFSFLWKWKMRGLAKGLADSMDLVRLVAAEAYTCGFVDQLGAECPDCKAKPGAQCMTRGVVKPEPHAKRRNAADALNRAAGRRVDEVIERAMDRAGVDMKADYGTAIHARTEPLNTGTDPDDKQARDTASCLELWERMGVVNIGTEIFTANDTTRSAGTFDHLSYVPGLGIVITDKKTSSKVKQTYDVQLSSYAYGDVYDVETDERTTLEEYVAERGWDPSLLNRDDGVIWWVKNGKTEARMLDLRAGWVAAQTAAWIRDERRSLGVAKNATSERLRFTEEARSDLLQRITSAPTEEALMTIWHTPANQAIWAAEHTQAAKAKKEAL